MDSPAPLSPPTVPTRTDETVGARRLDHWSTALGRWVARLAVLAGRFANEHFVLLAIGLVGLAVLGVTTWAAGEIYDAVENARGLARLDEPVLEWMVAVRSPWLDSIVTAFTTFGGPILAPIVMVVVVGVVSWQWRTLLPVTLVGIAAAGALVVSIVGKNAIARVRPPHEFAVPPYEFSPSFPSGHSLLSVVLGGAIAYLLLLQSRRASTRTIIVVAAVLYAFFMGLSRVYLGHHWLTDVLVGWALGAAWLALLITGHRLAVTIRRSRRAREASGGGAVPTAP